VQGVLETEGLECKPAHDIASALFLQLKVSPPPFARESLYAGHTGRFPRPAEPLALKSSHGVGAWRCSDRCLRDCHVRFQSFPNVAFVPASPARTVYQPFQHFSFIQALWARDPKALRSHNQKALIVGWCVLWQVTTDMMNEKEETTLEAYFGFICWVHERHPLPNRCLNPDAKQVPGCGPPRGRYVCLPSGSTSRHRDAIMDPTRAKTAPRK